MRITRIIILLYLWISVSHSQAWAADFVAEDDYLGELRSYVVGPNDNFYAIARRNDVGILELIAANPGIDPWHPPAGKNVIIPSAYLLPKVEHEGIVINLAELRLFYFQDDTHVLTAPVGVGRNGWETPTGSTVVIRKRKNPTWTPPRLDP